MTTLNDDVEAQSRQSITDVASETASDKPSKIAFDAEYDSDNPQCWSVWQKRLILLITCMGSSIVTCCSSIFSSASDDVIELLHVSFEVATLTITTFVLGIAIGPILLGPLSEFYGRRPIYLISFTTFLLLNFPVAFANNLAVLLIFRFLSGLAGSAFLANVGGSINDMYTPLDAYIPMALFACSSFFGPVLGPLIGGFVVQFSSRWQWIVYTIIIWSAVELVLLITLTPETLGNVILAKRAQRIRKESPDKAHVVSHHEEKLAKTSVIGSLLHNAKRVFVLLALEPLLGLLCLWTALLLGTVYGFFVIFPLVYERRGFSAYQIGLTFCGLGVSNVLTMAAMPFWKKRRINLAKRSTGSPLPEACLEPAMIGCLLSPIGLFIFAFTSYSHVHWIASIIGSCVFGIGLIHNFLAIFSYTGVYWRSAAASALAANALIRCSFAAAFPLFSVQMDDKLTTPGAVSLLAGLHVLMIPVPFLLYRYGPWLRSKSRYATT